MKGSDSMWIEQRGEKYLAVDRYKDYMTGKTKRVSVIIDKDSKQARNKADKILKAKIEAALNQSGGVNARFEAASQLPPPDPDAGKRQEQSLSSLIDVFGRDKVQIDE